VLLGIDGVDMASLCKRLNTSFYAKPIPLFKEKPIPLFK
jgi:hypothetical protein